MKNIAVAAGFVMCAATAQAATVLPTSYDMVNGNTGTFTYWDDTYNGSGSTTTSGASLTGGTGDLTDGVIATGNWNVSGETAKYVGWVNTNPTITFNFAQAYNFTSMTFHFDDADGVGGVSQPLSVGVNGAAPVVVPTNPGPAPFSFTYDLTGTTTDTLAVQIFRTSAWVFLSEVTFETAAPAVPLPAAGGMLLLGLAGFGAMRRRQAKA